MNSNYTFNWCSLVSKLILPITIFLKWTQMSPIHEFSNWGYLIFFLNTYILGNGFLGTHIHCLLIKCNKQGVYVYKVLCY